MGRWKLICAGAGLLAAAACSPPAGRSGPGDLAQPRERLTIVAGPVSYARSQGQLPPRLEGRFELLRSSSGIVSRGTGGACLVAKLGTPAEQLAPRCERDNQCTGGLPAGWGGYCIENSCWVRPGSQQEYCAMSPDRPLSVGTHKVQAPLLPARAAKWRVHACLNGDRVNEKGRGACSETDYRPIVHGLRRTSDGPVRPTR